MTSAICFSLSDNVDPRSDLDLYRENFRNLPVPSRKAQAYQILHVALCSGPLPRVPKL